MRYKSQFANVTKCYVVDITYTCERTIQLMLNWHYILHACLLVHLEVLVASMQLKAVKD